MRLPVRRLHPAAVLPTRAHDGDAGLDLRALEGATLAPGARALVRTGLAARHGITLVNAPGLIDAGFRGEVGVLLLNTDRDEAFTIAPGDRIAQLVVLAVAAPEPVEVDELASSARGAGGFGSTGRG